MPHQPSRHLLSLALLVFCLLLLLFAYGAEYLYNIKPCHLCVYLRYAYMALLVATFLAVLWPHTIVKGLEILCLIGAFSISAYHMGVEQHWWQAPESCRLNIHKQTNLGAQNFKENLKTFKQRLPISPIVACDQVNWQIFGISVTIWNTLLLFGVLLSVVGLRCVTRL